MKRVVSNFALLLVAFGVAAVFAEVVVRLLMKDETPLFPRYHTDYQYGAYTLRGIRANEVFWHSSPDGRWDFMTNNRGFRDTRDFDYTKPKDTIRVLTLGDSHTQGYEVAQNETYSVVLERYLDSQQRPAEVINTGVSGFSTAEALAFLENEGLKYQPDVVVLGFFENDYEDNFKAGLFELGDDGKLHETKFEHIPGVHIQNFIYAMPGVKWLSENSYFYSLLFNTAWNLGKVILTRAAARAAADKETVDEQNEAAFEFAVATADTVSPSQDRLAFALIQRMQRFCAANGIRLIVAEIPGYRTPYHTRPSLSPALREKLNASRIELLTSKQIVGPLEGAAEMHVLHGYHHISALTHAMIGVELGKGILARP